MIYDMIYMIWCYIWCNLILFIIYDIIMWYDTVYDILCMILYMVWYEIWYYTIYYIMHDMIFDDMIYDLILHMVWYYIWRVICDMIYMIWYYIWRDMILYMIWLIDWEPLSSMSFYDLFLLHFLLHVTKIVDCSFIIFSPIVELSPSLFFQFCGEFVWDSVSGCNQERCMEAIGKGGGRRARLGKGDRFLVNQNQSVISLYWLSTCLLLMLAQDSKQSITS